MRLVVFGKLLNLGGLSWVLAVCFGGLCVLSVCFVVGCFDFVWVLSVKAGFLDLLLWFCLL